MSIRSMKNHRSSGLATAPTWTRRHLAVALAFSALGAGAGCGAEGTFDIVDLRSSSMGIAVGAVRAGEATRAVGVSVGLPPLPSGACHQIPGDLDVTVNGHGPVGDRLTVERSTNGHSFTLGCTGSESYWLEGDFQVPPTAEVLTVKVEKDGEEMTARVTLPPDPPVAVTLGATELGRDSPITVDLRTIPTVLSSDATCWNASVISRAGDASSYLSVSSVPLDGGVRLQFALPADAPPLPSGPATLIISAWQDERCSLPVDVSCLGVASCSVGRDLSRDLGPFAVQVR